ncbi:MAG: ABC transporter substrate-binding protein [Desulfobacterales bacterium]|nr:ABC transporter substrate-binding protein [Desulfobacterales bacterium]
MKTKIIIMMTCLAVILAGIIMTLWYFSRPILIGAILPIESLTGNEANLFIRYYQDKNPKIGFRPIKFIIEDSAIKEDAVKNAYRKLNDQGVSFIIGGVLSKDAGWLAEESAKTGIPTFGIAPSSALLSGKKDGFFRLCQTNAIQAKAVAMYYQKVGVKRLVLVTSLDNILYVDPFVKAISENFSGEIVRIPFTPNEETYQNILSADPDGIFNILPARDVLQMLKAVREHRPNIKFGCSAWASDEILNLYSGPLLDGVLFFSLSKEIHGELYKTELAEFEKKYNMKATNASQYTVSILHILYESIREVGYSRAAIKTYFETPRTYDTCYGKMAMDDYGDVLTDRTIILETTKGTMKKKENL